MLEDRSKLTCADFNLPSMEDLQKQVEETVRRAVDDFVKGAVGELAFVYLRWSDELDPAHPLMVDVRVPLGHLDDPPIWKVDLEAEFRDYVEDRYGDRGLDEMDRPAIQHIRNKLMELVSYYDEKLKEGCHG